MTQLEKMKARLKSDDDTLLLCLLEEAMDFILAFTRRSVEQWLPLFDAVQVQIAIINYNRLGLEGVQSRAEGGISTANYSGGADYPDSVIKTLNPYRIARAV